MADGSQLRRRLRMATADEDVDTQAIANQTANELREQIEASPIPDRLEQVVAEDRPLASRVASADTPLVEEPDDSPSGREISFQLHAPTGRGAVRSALRTPGLSADLRPRTPFSEDETGIAPEQEPAAKPSAADADILEPEQAEEPDRSPAGPDRDALAQNDASDEVAGLHKAQRRDRRMAIASGVLRGVQALGSILGRATGAPGLAGLGGMAGVASGLIPQGRATEQFGQEHALRKEEAQARLRAEQTAYERAQDADQAKRAERQLQVNISNAESGQENARASRDMQNRLNETRLQEYQAENDPDHQAARTARGVFSAFLDAAAREKPELREDFADVTENLETMSASEIRGAIDQLKIFRNAPAGARRTRGGRGPGGGTPRPGTDWSQPLADPDLEFLAQQGFRRAQASGVQGFTIEAARAAASRASDNSAGQMTLGVAGLGNQNAEATGNVSGGRVNPDDVQRYGRELEEPNSMYRSFAGVVSAAQRANPELLRVALKGGDEMANVAGATDLRAQIFQMLNSYFHAYGGANIVDSEMRRYMSAFGQGAAIGNPSAFLAAVSRHAREAKARMDGIAGRYDPNVVRAYRENMRQIRAGRR